MWELFLEFSFQSIQSVPFYRKKPGKSIYPHAVYTRGASNVTLCQHRNIIIFISVIETGQSIKELVGEKDSHNNTVLHLAAGTNDLNTAEVCLQNGADIDARKSNNETPLHVATVKGNLKMVELLVRRGANVIAKNTDTKTVLHR